MAGERTEPRRDRPPRRAGAACVAGERTNSYVGRRHPDRLLGGRGPHRRRSSWCTATPTPPGCGTRWWPVWRTASTSWPSTRGAGASGSPSRLEDYVLDRLVEDFIAVADAVSPDRPVHLVAHDWGSIQSWDTVTSDATRAASRRNLDRRALPGPRRSLGPRATYLAAPSAPAARGPVAALLVHGVLPAPAIPAGLWRLIGARRFPATLRRLEGLEPREGAPGEHPRRRWG